MTLTFASFVQYLELVLAVAGAFLLWRLVLRPAARANRAPSPLAPWPIPLPNFLAFVMLVMMGAFIASLVAKLGLRYTELRGDSVTVVMGAAAQFGMLAGIAIYWKFMEPSSLELSLSPNVFVSGVATFLISFPLVILSSKGSEWLLELCGLPLEKQDLIGIFAKAESPGMLAVMLVLAVVGAPLSEELIFRAGLFRYLRTRIPRWLALTAPAVAFAVPHVNWETLGGLSSALPLAVLAITFSLAYERTGKIGTSIVAHALFNLNSVVVLFSGADK